MDKVRHDHSYCKLPTGSENLSSIVMCAMLQSESRDTTPTFQLCSDLLSTLDISLEERQRIELQTHKQSGIVV